MNKDAFVKYLSDKLYYLVDNEKEKEIYSYVSVIDNSVAMGQNEEDAVASFGSVDDLVTAIYLSHGLDYKKIYSGKVSGKSIISSFKNFFNEITHKDRKVAFNAILYFIYIVFLIILLNIVFIFVRDIGLQVFSDITKYRIAEKIYSVSFNVLYAITAIILFIKLFTKRFNK